MSSKIKVLIAGFVVLTAFAVGRYTVPEVIKTVTKTVEVEKKTEDKKTDSQDHKKVTIVDTVKPDGTKTRITTITDDRDTKTVDNSTDNTTKSETQSKEVSRGSQPLTVSLLASENISAPGVPVYGLAITRPVLGPITLGAFAFTNSTVGLSIGLTF